ncbi:MAG: helix-turn-helix domain-containing protein [Tardiphaga sp.]
MTSDKAPPSRKVTTRDRVLDAAERLLAQGSAGFSMRDLAEEAGVSFATPFNQFGSKAAIMLALSARRIAAMHARLAATALPAAAVARVLAAVEIAASVMLAAPAVNQAVMGAVGSPTDTPGHVAARSSDFWAEALGGGEGLADATRALALAVLPGQLTVAFRGVLSFWTAGEIPDPALHPCARAAAAAVLLGFAGRGDRAELAAILDGATALRRP